jgi:PIN domain nuclease of toxin-antitoxin system
VIFDASVLLALLRGEPGGDVASRHLPDAMISTVNLAEAMAVLIRKGMPAEAAQAAVDSLELDIVDFDRDQAQRSARLIPITDAAGLSLGDRACLALAQARRQPAVTAEKAWERIDAGIIANRITMLEQALNGQYALAAAEVDDLQRDLLEGFYQDKEQQRLEDEAELLDLARDLVTRLVRSKIIATSRGQDMQRFGQRIREDGPRVVQQLVEAGASA